MIVLYIGLVIIVAGIAYVAWLMWHEDKKGAPSQEAKTPPAKDSENTAVLLQRLGLEKRVAARKGGLLGRVAGGGKRQPAVPPQKTGTASLRLDEDGTSPPAASETQEKTPPATSELSPKYAGLKKQFAELQEKHRKLDSLFQEKSVHLNQTEIALDNELKNRKEFNKVKDLLEKELKDSRDKCRNLKIEATAAQTEAQSHLKRIQQLEEKIAKTGKNIAAKDAEVQQAVNEMESLKGRAAELGGKIKTNDEVMENKNTRIQGLVERLKETGAEGQPTSPPPPTEAAPSPKPAEPAPETKPPEDKERPSSPDATTEQAPGAPLTQPPEDQQPAAETSATKTTPEDQTQAPAQAPQGEDMGSEPPALTAPGAKDAGISTDQAEEEVPANPPSEDKEQLSAAAPVGPEKTTDRTQNGEPPQRPNKLLPKDKAQELKNLLDRIERRSPDQPDQSGEEATRLPGPGNASPATPEKLSDQKPEPERPDEPPTTPAPPKTQDIEKKLHNEIEEELSQKNGKGKEPPGADQEDKPPHLKFSKLFQHPLGGTGKPEDTEKENVSAEEKPPDGLPEPPESPPKKKKDSELSLAPDILAENPAAEEGEEEATEENQDPSQDASDEKTKDADSETS